MERNDEKIALPCPFCGHQAKAGVSIKDCGPGFEFGYCGCTNNQCHVRPKVGSVMGLGEGEKSAIRRWNYRK